MFDLETAIMKWRQQMRTAGIQSPALEELESHLREEIARQVESGQDGQNAFEISIREIGSPQALDREFKKDKRNIMKRVGFIALGSCWILFGPGLILPALAKHRHWGIWNFEIICPIVLGALITLAGLSLAIAGLTRRKA